MESINVYAKEVSSKSEDADTSNVYLVGVDVTQVVQEFNPLDVLDSLEWSDIIEYVTQRRAEDGDE